MDKQDALKRLSAIENEAAELRKLIDAPDRPTPAERFWQLCEGLSLKIDKEKYTDYVLFFKEDVSQFEYNTKNGYLWCRYSSIWSVFEKEYNMRYDDIRSLIKIQVEEHFRCKGVTPGIVINTSELSSRRTFKM